jgi:hypothetical protein
MKSTSAKLDQALAKLREQGHVAATDQTTISTTGKVMIPVDGILRSHNKMYAMAGMPLEPESLSD